MEILRELLRIVTSKSDSKRVFPELYESSSDENPASLAGMYLHGVINGTFRTDAEAAEFLYGVADTDVRYRVLKSRAIDRSVHAVLMMQIKTPEYSEYLSAYYKCTRNLIAAQTLLRFAARSASDWLARKTLTMARKYEFTDICLPLSVLLRDSAAFYNKPRIFHHLDDQVQHYMRVLYAEYSTTAVFHRLSFQGLATNTKSVVLVEATQRAMREFEAIADGLESHRLTLNRLRLVSLTASVTDQHSLFIKTCDEAIDYLQSKPHLSQPARIGEFLLDKMIVLVLLRRPAEALQSAEIVAASFTPGGRNWYLVYQFLTAASLQNLEFAKAHQYLREATSQRRFTLMPASEREAWALFGAYIYLAQQLRLYEPEDPRTFQNFRLSTFLNSIPELTREKKVETALVLIAQIFFLITEGDDDTAQRRIEYLKVYCSRYMRDKSFLRIRIFMRMLQAFPRSSFYPDEIERRNAELFKRLQEHGSDYMGEHVNEYIPFEVMYRAVLDVIRSRVYDD